MNTRCFTRQVLGYELTAVTTLLDSGLHVLIAGGQRTHVGAVTLGAGDKLQTVLMEGHHDHSVTVLFAQGLLEEGLGPVCVACGIHYDNASKEEIGMIMSTARELLGEMRNAFRDHFVTSPIF